MQNRNLRAYGLAVLATAAGLALTRVTWPFFSPTPFAPVFAAVAASTHWGSGRAGLLAILLSAVGAALMFPAIGPVMLAAFVGVALVGNRLIAGRNRASAALRASEAQLRATLDHLRASEDTIRRAQKMEAVGQLAAGVAHNFNNLLTITMGYTDTLLDRDADEEHNRIAIQEIRKATERGAALTRQLLAFGRKHDPRPERIDLGRALEDLREMLTRVIREDIRLTIAIGPEPASIMIDPFDLEQVMFNLVINARDALPLGGTIYLDVGRQRLEQDALVEQAVAPGEYVSLRVRDDGIGMAQDVQSHLFEPFFTTKEVGEGTGLGLAFVHGIAQHAGGFVTIDSAPGKGTTVSMFLPPAPAAPIHAATESPTVPKRRGSPSATILLVEDDVAVRAMTARMLLRAGYTVLAASGPNQAVALFEKHVRDIDLLLTDVVMPEMHGPALAEQLLERRPGLPVLFVSGYTEPMAPGPRRAERVAFLAKPFASAALVATVAGLLPPSGS
ncbi:MAG TPA: ATP-binding protein [Vicinamibacterales bacterium]|nr:ATP-binding protein [Vicinamibacterales bacterium]